MINHIKDFSEGMDIKGFFTCRKVNNKITRLGDEYLDLVLEDKTGLIRAKIWSHVTQYKNIFQEGDPVAVKGQVIQYNNANEINISFINYAEESIYEKYGYSNKNIRQSIKENPSILIELLYNYINLVDSDYRVKIKYIIDSNIDNVKNIPSINMKYNLCGGFLLEMVEILKINEKLLSLYKDFDKSLIVSGIVIKNIGLIDYFKDDALSYSTKHYKDKSKIKLLGINLINQYFKFKKYDVIKLKLQNIILSNDDCEDNNIKYINALYELNEKITDI